MTMSAAEVVVDFDPDPAYTGVDHAGTAPLGRCPSCCSLMAGSSVQRTAPLVTHRDPVDRQFPRLSGGPGFPFSCRLEARTAGRAVQETAPRRPCAPHQSLRGGRRTSSPPRAITAKRWSRSITAPHNHLRQTVRSRPHAQRAQCERTEIGSGDTCCIFDRATSVASVRAAPRESAWLPTWRVERHQRDEKIRDGVPNDRREHAAIDSKVVRIAARSAASTVETPGSPADIVPFDSATHSLGVSAQSVTNLRGSRHPSPAVPARRRWRRSSPACSSSVRKP